MSTESSPITEPLGDWTTVNEELYNNAAGKLEPTAHALARGKQGRAESIVAWTNTYNGKTKVFGTTLGHNNATVADPRYLDLVTRGLLWAVDKLDDRYLKRRRTWWSRKTWRRGSRRRPPRRRAPTIAPAPPLTAIPRPAGAPTARPARSGGRSTSASPRT